MAQAAVSPHVPRPDPGWPKPGARARARPALSEQGRVAAQRDLSGGRGVWWGSGTQTYPSFIHHDVVAPMLLGEVWGQDIKATAELRKHHVVRVT